MKKLILLLIYFSFFNSQYSEGQWEYMSRGMGTNQIVNAFSVCSNKIFAGTYGGLYYSTNYGMSWFQLNLISNAVLSLAVNGNNIYAGTNVSGVLRSTNNGTNWSQTTLNNRFVFSLATSGSYVYAGVNDSGIYVSSNYGETWTKTFSYNYDVRSLTVSGNSVFAGTSGNGVYISTNSGLNWTQTALNNKPVFCLIVNGINLFAGVYDIYNASERGVYLSSNNGSTWIKTMINNISVSAFAMSGNVLFAGTEGGVFLTTNNGTNWINKNQGFVNVPSVAALLILNNYIFAGSYNNSVWRRSFPEILTVQNILSNVPSVFSLSQNYPNPFNPITRINFDLPKKGLVSLKVFDILGRELQTLVNEEKVAGSYSVDFNASDFSSGVYFYRIESGVFSDVKRMILIK